MRINLNNFCLLFVVLNAIKLPLAFLGIHHATATIAQLFLIFIIFCATFIKEKASVGDMAANIFALFHTILILKEFVLVFIEGGSAASLASISVSATRTMSFYFLYIIFKHNISRFDADFALKILIYYLIFTSTISVLQAPSSPLFGVLNATLFDITSGNHLGFFRSTGGIGGTVIDYVVYLSFSSLLLFVFQYIKKRRLFLLYVLAFGVGMYFSFSRSLILVFLIVLLSFAFSFFQKRTIFITFVFFVSIIFNFQYFVNFWNFIVEINMQISGQSDISRLLGWKILLGDKSISELLIGSAVGVNSGFGALGSKVSGDGFVVTYISEYGVIGFMIFLMLINQFLSGATQNRSLKFIFFVILITCILINSGYEKLFNYFYFFTVVIVISSLERKKYCYKLREK